MLLQINTQFLSTLACTGVLSLHAPVLYNIAHAKLAQTPNAPPPPSDCISPAAEGSATPQPATSRSAIVPEGPAICWAWRPMLPLDTHLPRGVRLRAPPPPSLSELRERGSSGAALSELRERGSSGVERSAPGLRPPLAPSPERRRGSIMRSLPGIETGRCPASAGPPGKDPWAPPPLAASSAS